MDIIANPTFVISIALVALIFDVFYNYKEYGPNILYDLAIVILMLVVGVMNFSNSKRGIYEIVVLVLLIMCFMINIVILFKRYKKSRNK